MFSFRESHGKVEVAFTDRHRPDGAGGEAVLDLGEPRAGREESEARSRLDTNLQALREALADGGAGAPPTVLRMHQVHGAEVHTVREPDTEPGAEPPVVDGLVTNLPGVALLVRVADCVPVLLADPAVGVVGAAHAGRNGLVAGVVPATLARMRDLGARHVSAWVGPHICGSCYEVPAEMREDVAAVVPESFAETSWGTPAVDVGAGVLAQLRREDVHVHDVSGCTRERGDLHSHRRDGLAAGRLGGLVWWRR